MTNQAQKGISHDELIKCGFEFNKELDYSLEMGSFYFQTDTFQIDIVFYDGDTFPLKNINTIEKFKQLYALITGKEI